MRGSPSPQLWLSILTPTDVPYEHGFQPLSHWGSPSGTIWSSSLIPKVSEGGLPDEAKTHTEVLLEEPTVALTWQVFHVADFTTFASC